MQDAIVDLHNTYRNQQALGQTGFPTAARMATVVSELNFLYPLIERKNLWQNNFSS